jgi:hypothetical protein
MTEQPNAIELARGVVAELLVKHDALEERKEQLEAERDEIAYEAHTGNDKARAKLTRLNREVAEIDAEMASFDAAVREAEKRVIEAQGIERAEIERQRAMQALKRGRHMLDGLKAADRALAEMFAALHDVRAEISELHKLGYGVSTLLAEA